MATTIRFLKTRMMRNITVRTTANIINMPSHVSGFSKYDFASETRFGWWSILTASLLRTSRYFVNVKYTPEISDIYLIIWIFLRITKFCVPNERSPRTPKIEIQTIGPANHLNITMKMKHASAERKIPTIKWVFVASKSSITATLNCNYIEIKLEGRKVTLKITHH